MAIVLAYLKAAAVAALMLAAGGAVWHYHSLRGAVVELRGAVAVQEAQAATLRRELAAARQLEEDKAARSAIRRTLAAEPKGEGCALTDADLGRLRRLDGLRRAAGGR